MCSYYVFRGVICFFADRFDMFHSNLNLYILTGSNKNSYKYFMSILSKRNNYYTF